MKTSRLTEQQIDAHSQDSEPGAKTSYRTERMAIARRRFMRKRRNSLDGSASKTGPASLPTIH
jgi:hypothetical protein